MFKKIDVVAHSCSQTNRQTKQSYQQDKILCQGSTRQILGFFLTITWVSFDQSTSNFAGGWIISRHLLPIPLFSEGCWENAWGSYLFLLAKRPVNFRNYICDGIHASFRWGHCVLGRNAWNMSSVATRCVWYSNYVLDVATSCSDLDLALTTGIPVSGEYPMKKHESWSCRRAFL